MEQPNTLGRNTMSVGDPENEPQGLDNGNPDPSNNPGHPAWQEILEQLPEEFHPLITPKLEDWDKRVHDKLQGTYSKYDQYKPLIENNIPLDQVEQALMLAMRFQEDPEAVIKAAIENFDLKYVPADQIPSNSNTNDDGDVVFDMDDLPDLENHPAFKEIKTQAEQLAAWKAQQEQAAQEETAQEQLETVLAELHESKGEFDDLYVTTLMANGWDPAEAIDQYQSMINAELEKRLPANTPVPPPTVVGNAGNSGSGIPNDTTKMGQLSKNDVNSMVAEMIKASQSSQ